MTDNLCESCAHWIPGQLNADPCYHCELREVSPDSYKSTKVGCYAYKEASHD